MQHCFYCHSVALRLRGDTEWVVWRSDRAPLAQLRDNNKILTFFLPTKATVYCSIYDRNHRNDFDLEPRPHDLNRKRKSILQYFFGTNWCLWMWHLVGDVRVDDSTTDLRESRSLGVEDGTYLILLGVVELSFWNYGCHHVDIITHIYQL